VSGKTEGNSHITHNLETIKKQVYPEILPNALKFEIEKVEHLLQEIIEPCKPGHSKLYIPLGQEEGVIWLAKKLLGKEEVSMNGEENDEC